MSMLCWSWDEFVPTASWVTKVKSLFPLNVWLQFPIALLQTSLAV